MKLLIIAAVVVVAVIAAPSSRGNIFECAVCCSLVATAENWMGHEAEDREPAAIAWCEKEIKNWINLPFLPEAICEGFVKPMLDQVIAHMEDPTSEKKDAEKACKAMSMC